MISDNLYEIPRIFTSISEIAACLVYIIPMKKRHIGINHYLLMLAGAVALILIQIISGELPIVFWIPGMLTAMLAMFLFIRSTCDISTYDAGYLFIRAFILAEFVAAIQWQIYYYIIYTGATHSTLLSITMMILIYTPLFLLAYFLDAKKEEKNRQLGVTFKEMINALFIGGATFSINNVNFIIDSPFVIRQMGANILYIRTLVDFSGLLLLFAWNEQRREIRLNHEIKAMNDILSKHYDQYQISKEAIDLINRKHHDLKHQIALIKGESDPLKRNAYFQEIDQAMGVYESQYDTGNTVVDTILMGKSLYCKEHDINFSCVVDGALLNFILVMDICSIFGNALDNCVESVEKIEDKERRIIRVAVFSKHNYVIMRFENYYEEALIFQDGLPETTKKDKRYHGYGIKSIKSIVEKYHGNISISWEHNWFSVKVIIPLAQD